MLQLNVMDCRRPAAVVFYLFLCKNMMATLWLRRYKNPDAGKKWTAKEPAVKINNYRT